MRIPDEEFSMMTMLPLSDVLTGPANEGDDAKMEKTAAANKAVESIRRIEILRMKDLLRKKIRLINHTCS